MADTRTNRLDTARELERHLLDLAEEADGDDQPDGEHSQEYDLDAAAREIAWLRKEVLDLREMHEPMVGQSQSSNVHAEERPWLRIATTVALTFVLGKLVQRMRFGTAGAAAVPLVAAQIGNRIW